MFFRQNWIAWRDLKLAQHAGLTGSWWMRPCSGTGTLGRNPDAKWKLNPFLVRGASERTARDPRKSFALSSSETRQTVLRDLFGGSCRERRGRSRRFLRRIRNLEIVPCGEAGEKFLQALASGERDGRISFWLFLKNRSMKSPKGKQNMEKKIVGILLGFLSVWVARFLRQLLFFAGGRNRFRGKKAPTRCEKMIEPAVRF